MSPCNIAVLNCTANHTPTAGKRKNNAGKLAILETWVAEGAVWLQILLRLHQPLAGVWGGAHDATMHTPLAIIVRPQTGTHKHDTKKQNQSLRET